MRVRLRYKYYSVRRTLVNAQLLDKEAIIKDLEEDDVNNIAGQFKRSRCPLFWSHLLCFALVP